MQANDKNKRDIILDVDSSYSRERINWDSTLPCPDLATVQCTLVLMIGIGSRCLASLKPDGFRVHLPLLLNTSSMYHLERSSGPVTTVSLSSYYNPLPHRCVDSNGCQSTMFLEPFGMTLLSPVRAVLDSQVVGGSVLYQHN